MSTETSSPGANGPMMRIWDLPTRLFHWILVVLMVLLYLSGEEILFDMDWHMRFGQLALALVIYRVAWGFVGSENTRFANFLQGPKGILAYLQDVKAGKHWTKPGHNPAGAMMMIGLLGLVALLGVTGLFTSDDVLTDGPLVSIASKGVVDLMTSIHLQAFNLLLLLAAAHIGAALFYKFVKKDDLIHPLVTGVRPAVPGEAEPKFANPWVALGLFVASVVIVRLIVSLG